MCNVADTDFNMMYEGEMFMEGKPVMLTAESAQAKAVENMV